MFDDARTFSGISVNDLDAARHFYGTVLGLTATDQMGGLRVVLPGDAWLWVYAKGAAHQPASFTVLNFEVRDIDRAVAELSDNGVAMLRYPGMDADELGIQRGRATGHGPDIAWFTDPAGNILAVLDGG